MQAERLVWKAKFKQRAPLEWMSYSAPPELALWCSPTNIASLRQINVLDLAPKPSLGIQLKSHTSTGILDFGYPKGGLRREVQDEIMWYLSACQRWCTHQGIDYTKSRREIREDLGPQDRLTDCRRGFSRLFFLPKIMCNQQTTIGMKATKDNRTLLQPILETIYTSIKLQQDTTY